ncbi:hypothetical protein L3X38_017443 [Prunus dulcis]|uniref:Integrase zinc-binding domain-containing protein n=1 Tax=Prunus dulcis TaxID=3755 RepID=A0AAD4W949_PRUDU|nr:hypothetical protein L3X38_017443 [Prunus dulcis]
MVVTRLYVPGNEVLKREILEETHCSAFAMHPSSKKMSCTVKEYYLWPFMKKKIAEYVSKCLICQQAKAKRQKPSGLLQPLPIPKWKWEHITMDFVFKLRRTRNNHDGVWLQLSIGMSPYDALYGRQCRTQIYWDKVGEQRSNKRGLNSERLKVAQDRQKSYADNRRKELQFEVGDWVFLKLSSWKGVVRFGKRGKLSPHYIGPCKISERMGLLAYRLALR